MIDPHRAFTEWILDGATDDLSRTTAVHASACSDCRCLVEAFDELSRIEVGAVPLVAGQAYVKPRRRLPGGVLRWATGAATAALLVGTLGLALADRTASPSSGASERPQRVTEGVLGGEAFAEETATATATATGTASPSPLPSPSEPGAEPQRSDPPPAPATPIPTVVAAPLPTARITPPPALAPTPLPTPEATAVPTPPPTPVPTPVPTPDATPQPDDCEDAVDNDGDTLIDGDDPGCLLDGNEPSA